MAYANTDLGAGGKREKRNTRNELGEGRGKSDEAE
jgi:hypothetical protein